MQVLFSCDQIGLYSVLIVLPVVCVVIYILWRVLIGRLVPIDCGVKRILPLTHALRNGQHPLMSLLLPLFLLLLQFVNSHLVLQKVVFHLLCLFVGELLTHLKDLVNL